MKKELDESFWALDKVLSYPHGSIIVGRIKELAEELQRLGFTVKLAKASGGPPIPHPSLDIQIIISDTDYYERHRDDDPTLM